MRFLQHHVLDLHQAGGVAAFVFVQLHGDIADVLLGLRDHHIFQRVDTAAGLFNVLCQQLHGLFHLCQLQHIGKNRLHLLQCRVQLAAGLGKAVGQQRVVAALGVEGVHRRVDAHDVLGTHLQRHAAAGTQQRLFQHLRPHDGGRHREGGVGLLESLFHLGTKLPVAAHHLHELLHQFVPLILQKLVAPLGGL